jgi:hypothetical protein
MDKRGDRRMKVIVKFTNEEAEYWGWPQELLDKQKKQGYINVIKLGKRYLVDEIGIPKYGIDKDWIERIIEE